MDGCEIQIDRGGFVRIHHAILEQLAQTELTGRQWRLLMALLRLTYGYNKKEDAIALSVFCEATGMKKPNVSVALKELVERKIIYRRDAGTGRGHIAVYGFNKYFKLWKDASERLSQTTIKVTDADNLSEPIKVIPNANKGYPKRTIKVIPDHERTIDSKTKTIPKTNSVAQAPTPPTTHPAILAFDELGYARPPKRLLHLIEDAGIADLDLWRAAVNAWIGSGHNPIGVIGMLDWYRDPQRFQRNGNGAQRTGPSSFAQQSQDAGDRFRERMNQHGHAKPVTDAFRLLPKNAGG